MKTDSNKKIDTIILGAGISGLTLGYYLDKKNQNFLIFDSKKMTGGNISSNIKDGFICENGPNTVLLNNASVREIIKDIGLSNEIIYPNTNNKKRFLIKNGKLVVIPTTLFSFLRTNLLSCIGKIKIFSEIFKPKHKNNTSVYDFFSKRFGNEFHNIFIEPILTGVYAGNTREMSMKHVLKKVWEMEQKDRSIILSFIKNSYKKNNLKSFNFKNGLTQLIYSIENKIEDKIRLNSNVTKIEKLKNGFKIIINQSDIYICNRLISTIPSYSLANIIYDKSFSKILKKISYSPIYVLHIGLEKSKIKENINGFGVLTKPSDKKSFLGVLFNSRIFPHVSPEDYDLLTVMIGGSRQPELIELNKEVLKSKILTEIKELLSYNGQIIMQHDYLWEKGIPQYALNHSTVNKSLKKFHFENKNFYILGSFIDGISVSDCIGKAKKLAVKL
tara:strand:+ start:8837 stop:10168 length:1332 start_codon:yes stop_codon:yes gene_type:complete